MSVMVKAELGIRGDKWDEAIDLFRSTLVDTRQFEGCERLDAYLDPDGHEVRFIEQWTSPEAQQAYIAARVSDGSMEKAGAYLTGAPDFTVWQIADDL